MIKRLLVIAVLALAGCRQEPELVTEPADYVSTLFGELILKIIDDGRLHVLNGII